MLEELRIDNLGVIAASTLELHPGLTVITGETGAGKTMVVTALGLLLGGRADAGAVRHGASSARIQGVFASADIPGLTEAVAGVGGEIEDDRLLAGRTISVEGRSRAFVGGAAVPISVLGSMTQPFVAIHGQSDQHRLLRPAMHREALDRFAGEPVEKPLGHYRVAFDQLRAVETELAQTLATVRERAQEADLLRFGLGEIEAVSPQAGEEESLRAEENRLAHADALRTAAERAREALSGGDGERSSHGAAGWGAVDAAGVARHALDPVRAHDEGLAALADRLAELTYLLADISADLSSYAASVESDPARLAAVSNRRAELGGLTRKYGDTVAEVLAWAENSAARLLVLEGADDRVAELSERRQGLRRELAGHAAAISAARTEAAVALARQVTAELGGLAMPHAALSVVVAQQADAGDQTAGDALVVGERRLKFGPHGVDDVEFLLAANAGSEARSLARGASGGELSRIMLALEVVLAETASAPTFVFDEVDAGVGGKAAVEVGRRLAQLAKTAQVVVVTHLPQVAAFADRHVAVRKADDGLVTSSGLESLDDAGRERELSRMLAGLEDSSSAREHARELLATARADQG